MKILIQFTIIIFLFSNLFSFSIDRSLHKGTGDFYDYLFQVEKIEEELVSLEVDDEIERKSRGRVRVLYDLYMEKLDDISLKVTDSDLEKLEKYALSTFIKLVKSSQIYHTLYKLSDESEEDKKIYLNSRKSILNLSSLNSEDSLNGEIKTKSLNKEELLSLIKTYYAENLFYSIEVDRINTIPYVLEIEDELNQSQRLGMLLRTKLISAMYFISMGDFDRANIEVANQELDDILFFKENHQDKYIRSYLVFQAWIFKAQYHLSRKDRESALVALSNAREIYPKSGFLRYVTLAAKYNRPLKSITGGLAEIEKMSEENIYYEYNFDYGNYFLYQSFFNFVSLDGMSSPYLGVGNYYSPISLYIEAGNRWKIPDMTFLLAFKHKNSFKEIGEYYSIKIDISWFNGGFSLKNRFEYGSMWQFHWNQKELGYYRDDIHSLEDEIGLSYLLYQDNSFQLSSYGSVKYFIPIDSVVRSHLFSSEIGFKQLNRWGWGRFKSDLTFNFTGRNETDLWNHLTFFSKSPIPLSSFKHPDQPFSTSLTGDWLSMLEVGLQFYPLYWVDTLNAVKSIFIAPTFFVGYVGTKVGTIDGLLSYSFLGNIGFTFPGNSSISFGFGLNQKEEWVINILAY